MTKRQPRVNRENPRGPRNPYEVSHDESFVYCGDFMRFPAVATQYERIQWMRAISEAEFYPFLMPPRSVHNDHELRQLIRCWLFYVLKQQRELGRIAWREQLAFWLLRIKKEAK